MLLFSRFLLLLILVFSAISCKHQEGDSRIEIQLKSSWEFRKIGNNAWFPACIPGSIAENIQAIENKGNSVESGKENWGIASWEFRTKFDLAQNVLDQDYVQICFEGCTQNAEIFLNDSSISKGLGINRYWSGNCKSALKSKDNVLSVRFRQNENSLLANGLNSNVICDEKYSILDQGIAQPIYLLAWSTAKIEDIFLQPDSISTKRAVYATKVTIKSVSNQIVNVEYFMNNRLIVSSENVKLKRGENSIGTKVIIDKPKFWWTNGLGGQNLYTISVRLKREKELICEEEKRFGIRSIEIIKKTDKDGSFRLNGYSLFVKGASYIPSNQFSKSVDIQKQLIETAKQSNFNLIKVSGTIVDNNFYDLCDENGILVWQDMIDTKSAAFTDSVDENNINNDVIGKIIRFRNHPCMAMWYGNEICINGISINAKEKFQKIIEKDLPKLVEQYCSENNYLNYKAFTNNSNSWQKNMAIGSITLSNNISSLGFVLNANKSQNEEFRKEQVNIDKYWDATGNEKNEISTYLVKNFNKPKDIESEVYTSWIAQSELLKATIESSRAAMPKCMGFIYNELSDYQSWKADATLDSSGWWKPSQYAISHAFSHIIVVPLRENDMVNIYVVSDALKNLDAILLAKLIDFNGNDYYVKQIPVEIKANTSSLLLSIKESELLKNVDKTKNCLVVQINQASKTLSQNILYFSELKNLYQPKANISFDINEAAKGYNLILRSPVLVKNLVISTDDKKCWFSDNNIDLLPGKRTKINIRYRGTKVQLEKTLHFWSLANLNLGN